MTIYNELVIINLSATVACEMFKVDFYEDKQGRQPIRELLVDLRDKAQTSKDARIQYHKILAYIRALEKYGTRIGEPTVKHVVDGIWELRPLTHRILFFYWQDNKFILLHHFIKKTKKTPSNEIMQARCNMQDFKERGMISYGSQENDEL